MFSNWTADIIENCKIFVREAWTQHLAHIFPILLNCTINIYIVLIDPVCSADAIIKVNERANSALLQKFRSLSGVASTTYNGPSYEDALKIRKEFVTPSAIPFYRKPLLIHKGEMQFLYDHKGVKYLDLFGGIVTVSVGHCHP